MIRVPIFVVRGAPFPSLLMLPQGRETPQDSARCCCLSLRRRFSANQGWINDSMSDRELLDINNDGTIDIVGFGQNGVLAGPG